MRKQTCIYIHTYICTYVCMHAYVCVYVCMCVYVYIFPNHISNPIQGKAKPPKKTLNLLGIYKIPLVFGKTRT